MCAEANRVGVRGCGDRLIPPGYGRLLPWHILVLRTGTQARALAPHLRTRAVSHRLQRDRLCGPPVAFVA
eukprot:5500643-Pleurochrysis_carterae.AAC.1